MYTHAAARAPEAAGGRDETRGKALRKSNASASPILGRNGPCGSAPEAVACMEQARSLRRGRRPAAVHRVRRKRQWQRMLARMARAGPAPGREWKTAAEWQEAAGGGAKSVRPRGAAAAIRPPRSPARPSISPSSRRPPSWRYPASDRVVAVLRDRRFPAIRPVGGRGNACETRTTESRSIAEPSSS